MESEHEEVNLEHIGIIRRSGRYPWGSGGTPYQRSKDFKTILGELRSQGLSDTQAAAAMGIKTTELRANISSSTAIIFAENQALAQRLATKDGGMSVRAIAERMLGDASKESTVRGWLKTANEINEKSIQAITNILREHQAGKTWLDVGTGNEHYLGISDTKLRTSLAVLRDEGYETWSVKVPQLGTGQMTELKILGPPGSTWGEAKAAVDAGVVYTIKDKSLDGGLSFLRPKDEPVSVSSKRIEVRYAEDGGREMDGTIELRRGVPDLNLNGNRYAQVRVAVDGTHYLKGMAMYADDLPAGTDIRYNSAKTKAEAPNKLDAMKPLKEGPENAGNRFGAQIKPHPNVYLDSKGKTKTSALNLVNEEGDWDNWSKTLSSQMLSKQSVSLASTQLAKAQKAKQKEFDEIMALTNPVVRKQMLLDFADSADSAAVHLKAAKINGQSSHAILPMNSMRTDEVYAPNFDNGTKVALVRYPHGGPFEIPQLTVNNNNRTAKRIMGTAKDAIGIHHSVAERLSGADFDGDTVLVIPNANGKVKSRPALDELKNFDPKTAYPEVKGMTYMTKANTQKEMGKVSNLITDMTIKGANTTEIARAVKHSMVVIDAEKKNLNYKQSEKDNGIAQLKTIYQGGANKGAATIISRSGSVARPPQRRLRKQSEGGDIDPKTGELRYVETGRLRPETRINKRTGESVTTMIPVTSKTTKGELAKDAYTLSSGEPMENVYAAHANSMKALANQARLNTLSIKDPPHSKAAKAYYAKEVALLKAKLKEAEKNAPLERRAQIVGNATARARIKATPDMDKDLEKKIKYQSLADARLQTGASKQRIGSDTVPFTQREWDAIQAGAISSTVLRRILSNSNMDRVKELATPKYNSSLTPGQLALIKSMSSSGRGLAEISAALGIPKSTIADNLKKG